MRLIWATRGRTWGFRFLRDAGYADPLPAYTSAFDQIDDGSCVWRRGGDGTVALRFPDPEGRKDRAGRVIPHDFVIFPPEAESVHSLEDGLRLVWPEVADEFSRVWE